MQKHIDKRHGGALHPRKINKNDGFHPALRLIDPPQFFLIFSPQPRRPSRQERRPQCAALEIKNQPIKDEGENHV